MRKIHYWCTGQWCETHELEAMLVWMSDDYTDLDVDNDWADEVIDAMVHDLVG